MPKSYFEQFADPAWEPMPLPPRLDDQVWKDNFNQASPEVKISIANGWLYELNLKLKSQPTKEMVRGTLFHLLSKQHVFMRELLPLVKPELHKEMPFDGTMTNLVQEFVDIDSSRKDIYAESLQLLWFGDNEAKLKGATLVVKAINDLVYFRAHVDLIENLVTKLVWDVVRKNRKNVTLRKDAAFVSCIAGSNGKHRVDHEEVGNRIWYLMGKASKDYVSNFARYEGMDMFHAMHKEPLLVTATLIPSMMRVVRDVKAVVQPYPNRRGLVCAVDKTLTEVTDYDVLRVWIPSKKEFWDTAEALGIPYMEACASVRKEALQVAPVVVALPSDVAGEADSLRV